MEHAPAAHGTGYYATRATIRGIVYTAITGAFIMLPGVIEKLADALTAGLGL